MQPISQFQADCLSFGFRPQRSAIQAIVYISRKLCKSSTIQNKSKFKYIKVEKKRFDLFFGKKVKLKSFKVSRNKKRNQKYNYGYWIYLGKKCSKVPLEFYSQYYYLNVDILKCFDKMPHKVIFEKVPLVNKYLYLIKS